MQKIKVEIKNIKKTFEILNPKNLSVTIWKYEFFSKSSGIEKFDILIM